MSGALHISGPFHGESFSLWYVLEESEPCSNGDADFDTLASFRSHEAAEAFRIEREAARAAGEGK